MTREQRTDTERLDWLEQRVDGTGETLSFGGVCYWGISVGRKRIGEGDDLRSAIDDAIDAGSRDLTHRPVWTRDQREVAYPASRPAKEPDRFRFPEVGGWAKWLSNGASDWVTGGTYFVRRGSC